MDPIQEAIEYIESREAGDKFSYRQVAKMFGVDRTTLSRRHRGAQRPRDTQVAEDRRNLNPQQEDELIRYIDGTTRAGVPPTRSILKNFGSAVAQHEVSESWVTRFQHRHPDELITKWDTGIDRERHLANNKRRYELYFNLLHSKMREHGIEERNTYNIDEKGFFVGITARSKRIFTKRTWVEEKRTAAIQDGSRKWITLLACVCASGEALPPALIYEGSSGIQSSWLDDVQVDKHKVFFSNSPSGWTNNELGMAWLEQVFERFTKGKARRQYRLLILDGHGSHVTSDFIDFCDSNKILLAIFPPHATHSLQPLDVVVFAPLAAEYSRELDRRSQRSQGLATAKKDSFFEVF